MTTKNKESKPTHRLLIKIRDKNKPITENERGTFIPVKWVEVIEVELGSKKKPNKEILEIRLEPIEYEDDDEDKKGKNPFDIFGRF